MHQKNFSKLVLLLALQNVLVSARAELSDIPTKAADAQIPAMPAADDAWKALQRYNRDAKDCSFEGLSEKDANLQWYASDRQRYMEWLARLIKAFRSEGAIFWNHFPGDERRYQWLRDAKKEAFNPYLKFPSSPESVIDSEAERDWNRQYLKMRAEYMSAPDTVAPRKVELRYYELRDQISRRPLGRELPHDPVLHQLHLAIACLDAAEQAPTWWGGSDLASKILTLMDANVASAEAFLAAMRFSNNESVKQLALGRSAVMRMRREPLSFSGRTLAGKETNLDDSRGKVVLVDIWANYCATCIDEMPRLQKVYARYKELGFEVLGIWLETDGNHQASKPPMEHAKEILERQGVEYPNVIMEKADIDTFFEKYGIQAVPVTWLLDQNGLLVATDVRGQKLEREVRRLLGLPALDSSDRQ